MIFSIQIVFVLGLCLFILKRIRYLKSPLDNVPGPPSQSLLFGHLGTILHRAGWDFATTLTESYQGVVKLYGAFGRRDIYVYDPLAMHHILVKDQHIYEEAQWFLRSNLLTFGPGLLGTVGSHHKKQRKLLNPVFSIAHMRRMIPIFNEVTHRLQKGIHNVVSAKEGPVEIDMLEWMGRTALELIGQSGLGYSFDPLVSESADEFATAVKEFQGAMTRVQIGRRFLSWLPRWGKGIQGRLMHLLPNESVQKLLKITEVLTRRSTEIFEAKKRALEGGDEQVSKQIGEGKDIISILMRENVVASAEEKMSDEELLGQVSTFIFAAMDTTSTALSKTLLLLAEHPDVQEKVRREILDASNGEDFDYDTLVSLPYLDAICRETLRVYPPVSFVSRETREDVVLPVSEPIHGVDGTLMNEILVPKDTFVYVSIYSANRSKAIWGPDATEWKPERWLAPLPASVTDAKIPGIYSNLMTFIGGGRSCIGFKFSQLEMKIVLCVLLGKFTFAPSTKAVVWNMSGIQFPSVGYDSPKPAMPLMVGLYKGPTVS